MHKSNIEWHNDQELAIGQFLDQNLYPHWIKALKGKYKSIKWHRDIQVKRQNIPNYIHVSLPYEHVVIDEYFVFGTKDSVYLKVSEDKIKPLPRVRVYSYLFEDPQSLHIPFFGVRTWGEDTIQQVTLYIYTYANILELLKSVGLSDMLLYNEDKRLRKQKKSYDIQTAYSLYYFHNLRSRPVYLKISRQLFESYASRIYEVKKT